MAPIFTNFSRSVVNDQYSTSFGKADFTDMMYAENAEDVRKKRKAFLAKWRLRCRCSAPGSLDTSLSHAAGLSEIAACHA